MTLPDLTWEQVPDRVVTLWTLAQPLARELRAVAGIGAPEDRAWWNPATGQIQVQSQHKQAAWRAALVPGVALTAEPPQEPTWVLIKPAAFLAPLARTQDAAERLLGGPNPMASAITGGLLGAGLGYGAGWLGEQFLPEESFTPGRLRRTLALAGAGLGAWPGLHYGLAQARIPEAGGSTAPGPAKYFRPGPWLSDYAYKHALFEKAAEDFTEATGAFHAPTIPVDAFNRAIWNDVGGAPNRYGTKSPWGTDEQPMTTPPNIASFASGIVTGAGAATGQRKISPLQIAATAGLAAGTGYLAGMGLGKVFGVLAGLKPAAQRQLQRSGLWAGLITGAVQSLFHPS